jgi:glutamine synthetase adenylyltransferase
VRRVADEHAKPADRAADADRGDHAGPEHVRGTALARLAELRRDANAAYVAISAADAALESLAGQRVAGERVLRGALARYQAASRALAAHARAKPGRVAQLRSGFRAGREWLARQTDLNAAVREANGPLTAARRTVSGVKSEFAAQVRVRAEAATALRRLTAECVTVLAEVQLEKTQLQTTSPGEGGGADTPAAAN